MSHTLPTSSPGVVRRPHGIHPHLPTSRFCCSSLRHVPHACACLHSCVRSTPCCLPQPAPRYLSVPGGYHVACPFAPLCPYLFLPVFYTASCNILVLGLSFNGCPFSRKWEGPVRLHSLGIACPDPPPALLVHDSFVRLPPPPTPLSLTTLSSWSHPVR